MKTLFKVIQVIFVVAILAGCSMGEETATVVLSLGQTARAVSLSEVSHVVVFSGPGEGKTVHIGPGGGSVSVVVTPGTWTITVTGYYQNQVYATGSATADVTAGRTTNVSIQMTVVYVEPPVVPPTTPATPISPPVDNRPDLGAQGFLFRIGSDGGFLYSNICVVGNIVSATAEPGTASAVLGTEDFTWQWQVDGQPVLADLTVDPSGNSYVVVPNDLSKKVTVTATHPDYKGEVTLRPMDVWRELNSDNWNDFTTQFGSTAFPATGNYVLTDSYVTASEPVGSFKNPFNGTFDGNGETIDLNITTVPSDKYIGLFGVIESSGTVKNLNITGDVYVIPTTSTDWHVGAVAGQNSGQIINVSVDITRLEIFSSSLSFNGYIGGITGTNVSVIKNCSVYGGTISVINDTSMAVYAGGIAGDNYTYGVIQNCWVKEIMVNSQGSSFSCAGGIAGINNGNIQKSVVFGSGTTIDEITGTTAGRIWGSGPGTGNENWGDISVLVDGTSAAPPLDADKPSGADATSTELVTESWWTDHWGSVWGDDWDEEKPWVWGSSDQPTLWFNW